MKSDIPASNSLFVASLAKGFAVLRCFGHASGELTIREIMNLTGFDRSQVQRLTNTLHSLGYLGRNEKTHAYRLGIALLGFSFEFLRANPFLEIAMPCLVCLSEEIKTRVTFGLRDGPDVVYVYRVPRTTFYHSSSHFGERQPIYATAAGRAIAAFLPKAEAYDIIASIDRKPLTKFTKTDIDSIMHELDLVRDRGYCVQHNEFIIGESVLAAPVFGPNGQPRAVVAVSTYNANGREARDLDQLAVPVIQAARHISVATSKIPTRLE